MRVIETHKVNVCNESLMVRTVDEPGCGGASHEYRIEFDDDRPDCLLARLSFQSGPIAEVGTNGITHEALLAVIRDRLESFQAGPYKCVENQSALDYVCAAMEALKRRTLNRVARGVEGTHAV